MKRLAAALCLAVASTAAAQPAGILIGVDNAATPVRALDGASWVDLFTGQQAWGLAVDNGSCTVYGNNGSTLWRWSQGDPAPTVIGPITLNGVNQALVGLAFNNGRLYGVKNIATEGLYEIDPATGVAALLFTYDAAAFDLGGLDFYNGRLYATNDDTAPVGSGLVEIDLAAQTLTLIAPYPVFAGDGGATKDIDGLAIDGAGVAYFIVDEDGEFGRYDIPNAAVLSPIPNPYPDPTSRTFSAAAFGPCLFGPPPCPADFNNDGFLDFFDYDDYVSCFESGACPPGRTADFNNDGFADFFDYDDFVTAFERGC